MLESLSISADSEPEFVGSVDCGTTSCRFYIFDVHGAVVAYHQKDFEQLYPEPGWHEHDPLSYTKSIDECISIVMVKFEGMGYKKEMLKGVGIATQRETTILWDRKTGKPLYNAIAWPDARNASTVRALRQKAKGVPFETPLGVVEGEEGVRAMTGLPFSTYFSAVKYVWMLENLPEVKRAKEEGTLMMGTVDSWLIYNYTATTPTALNGLHVTDVSNASRTLLLSLHSLQYDPALLDFFDIPASALPRIVSNSEVYGRFGEGHPLEGVKIAGLVGDQQGALVGNMCLAKGSVKQTYGTGCFMLYNTGQEIVASTHGLLTTIGYQAGPQSPVYFALEGSVAVGGSSIQWLRDNLEIIKETREAGELAAQVEDTGGVYFVTGFSGLFAPYWDIAATGMLIGLSTYTTRHHIARATLEATCFQTRAILEAMGKDTVGTRAEVAEAVQWDSLPNGHDHHAPKDEGVTEKKAVSQMGIQKLKVDGGMTASDLTMQIQADILGIEVERPEMRESTALGAALLAGSALKLFGWSLDDPATLKDVNQAGVKIFKPSLAEDEREWKYKGWERAINRSRGWKTTSGNG